MSFKKLINGSTCKSNGKSINGNDITVDTNFCNCAINELIPISNSYVEVTVFPSVIVVFVAFVGNMNDFKRPKIPLIVIAPPIISSIIANNGPFKLPSYLPSDRESNKFFAIAFT